MKTIKIFLIVILFTVSILAEDRDDKIIRLANKIEQSEYKDVKKTIIAIAVLESSWFQNQKHREFKNYFSVKDWKDKRCETKPIYCLKKFSSLEECIDFMIGYFRKKGFPNERQQFIAHLKVIGYAEDPLYEEKLIAVRKSVKKKLDFLKK